MATLEKIQFFSTSTFPS
eukprot:Gb_15281 [translate_table: standard]